jgi:hypothetical protein
VFSVQPVSEDPFSGSFWDTTSQFQSCNVICRTCSCQLVSSFFPLDNIYYLCQVCDWIIVTKNRTWRQHTCWEYRCIDRSIINIIYSDLHNRMLHNMGSFPSIILYPGTHISILCTFECDTIQLFWTENWVSHISEIVECQKIVVYRVAVHIVRSGRQWCRWQRERNN